MELVDTNECIVLYYIAITFLTKFRDFYDTLPHLHVIIPLKPILIGFNRV